MQHKHVLSLLREVLQAAQMERAEFSRIIPNDSLPQSEKEVTAFIKERTRIYRESWIINPLKEVIDVIEGE